MPQPAGRAIRFLRNVLWNWMGTAFSMAAGLLLAPLLIRTLGVDGYGVWALVFSLMEYYEVLDFGFRSAVVKYAAHYFTLNEPEQLHAVINTSLVYFSAIGSVVMLATIAAAPFVHEFFPKMPPVYWSSFAALIVIVGASWSLGAVGHSFSACLEGCQRFDLSNRAWMVYNAVRVTGCATLCLLGYGLVPLGLMVVVSHVLMYVLNYFSFRSVVPGYRFRPRAASFSMFKQLVRYGSHTFLANSSLQVATQAPTTLIGHFLTPDFAGYYALSARLIQSTVDVTERVGYISGSSSAELTAKGEMDALARMGVIVNRYCLMVFAPIAAMLLVYGGEIIRTYARKQDYVIHSAPLLPVLLVSAIVLAGQGNSFSILYGLGKQKGYARGLLVEACLSVASLWYAIPRYGIMGAACVVATLLVLNRGIVVPWYLCRVLKVSYLRYVASIYVQPLLTGIPGLALAYFLKAYILPGSNLVQLLAASAIVGVGTWGLGFFTTLEVEHRTLFLGLIQRRLRDN